MSRIRAIRAAPWQSRRRDRDGGLLRHRDGPDFQLLPLLMEQRGVPAWIMGLNAAMGPLGILLAGPFLPRIVARVARRRVVYVRHRADHRDARSPSSFPEHLVVVRHPLHLRHRGRHPVHGQRGLDPRFRRDGNRGRIMASIPASSAITFASGH